MAKINRTTANEGEKESTRISQFLLLEVQIFSITLENSLALNTKVKDIFIMFYGPAILCKDVSETKKSSSCMYMCVKKHTKIVINVSKIPMSADKRMHKHIVVCSHKGIICSSENKCQSHVITWTNITNNTE